MMTARFFSGASLFALLIVDICCLPVKKGSGPGASYGGGHSNAAPNYDSYHGASSGQYSPGAVGHSYAPSAGVSTSYEAAPEPSVPQPAVHRGPASSAGSSSSSGPAFQLYRGNPMRLSPANSGHSGAAFQLGPRDMNWAVAPPSLLSGGEEMSTGARAAASSQPENVSPPESMYQAGELSHFEESFEHGNSERETEEQGWMPPPPPLPFAASEESAGAGFISQPQPDSGFISQPQPEPNMGGSWFPYPYYDYMFLTGQYPPGTVTHTSSSFEQGRDHWQDAHYERYYQPQNPAPAEQTETFTDLAAPLTIVKRPVKTPVMAGYRQGGARTAPSHGRFRQPAHSQAGGNNMVKGGQ
ncbi:hypothetical protein ABVT39_028245 [Epinephelus coioides]